MKTRRRIRQTLEKRGYTNVQIKKDRTIGQPMGGVYDRFELYKIRTEEGDKVTVGESRDGILTSEGLDNEPFVTIMEAVKACFPDQEVKS